MSLIRKIEISHFRGIKSLVWMPTPGLNCLVGPGDSGKSSVLDAIDLCLGARRNIQMTDADFFELDVDTPIEIAVTVGALRDRLKRIDAYSLYLRGMNSESGEIEDEPAAHLETILTLQLVVQGDLEPTWTLESERASAQGQSRNLNWRDRIELAPTRLGAAADYNLSWRRGSVLNRMSGEEPDASAALVEAARVARETFGDQAKDQLEATLETITEVAHDLGIPVGDGVRAMLDTHSVSFSGGAIALYTEAGIPLRGLGLGSTRLLIAGLQRRVAEDTAIVLIDEVEHGLEPHRIIRLLDALGAKGSPGTLQPFMTTHSPVPVRELSGDQLWVLRAEATKHCVRQVGTDDDLQGAVRSAPDALLSKSVLVCEGASEVGLIRGLDHYRIDAGEQSITAHGASLVDGSGGSMFARASAFQKLGYRTAVLRDSDVLPTPDLETAFIKAGGRVFCWRDDRALEQELFLSLSDESVHMLLECALEWQEEQSVDDRIEWASKGQIDLAQARSSLGEEVRVALGTAAKGSKNNSRGWFKTVSAMQEVGREIVGPGLSAADADFCEIVESVFGWIADGQ
jgi:hypothetical protein